MMKSILFIAAGCLFLGCSSNSTTHTEDKRNANSGGREAELTAEAKLTAGKQNMLTKEEKEDGWELLFDGTNTDKWTAVDSEVFPENGWAIENGALVLAEGGNIITRDVYSDFDLKFEFNMTPAANSGIKYYVTKLKNKESGAVVNNGPEYQIIDDFSIDEGANETEKTAAVYLLYEAVNKELLPPGQWNTGRIVSKDKQVEHWLNGVKVLSYERGSEDFRKRREGTKFKNYDAYGEVPDGHIYLTDHGDKVYFRNLKIKRL